MTERKGFASTHTFWDAPHITLVCNRQHRNKFHFDRACLRNVSLRLDLACATRGLTARHIGVAACILTADARIVIRFTAGGADETHCIV